MGEIWKATITDALNKFFGKILTFLPNLLAMITILIIGFLIAWVLDSSIKRQLELMREQFAEGHALSN